MIVKRNKFKEGIFKFFELFNLGVFKLLPRTSTKEIKRLFGNKELVGVEIGVYEGKNAKSILDNLNIRKLFLVDPYKSYTDKDCMKLENHHTQKELKDAFNKAFARLSRYKDKVEFKRNNSDEAINSIPNDLDFVYIDGAHDYESIKKDLKLYYPKLKKGGVLSGHDIQLRDVWRAVFAFAIKHKLTPIIEINDWFMIKTKEDEKKRNEKIKENGL